MKKFLIIAAVLLLVMSTFSIVSFADASTDVNVGDVPNTLSVPAGSDYAFYAQTRTNRLDSNKKDVRIICVADQEWITSIPNFVATFTFTDGSTPVSLKSVGLDVVFKEVVTYGTNGNVETYAAADGAVIFGWVITDVPAEYADVAAKKPTISVTTEAGVKPEAVMPDVDYDTPVLENKDINVNTDGIYHLVTPNDNNRVTGFDNSGAKATYIVTGNYDGFYEIELWLLSRDKRPFVVTVNGVSQVWHLDQGSSDWDDPNTAVPYTVTVLMKNGANVISIGNLPGNNGIKLVDLNLKRVADAPQGETVKEVFAPTSAEDETDTWSGEGVTGNDRLQGGDRKKLALSGGNTATSTLTDMAAGEYLLTVYYTNGDNTAEFSRMLRVVINGEEYAVVRAARAVCGHEPNYKDETVSYFKITLVDGENTIGFSSANTQDYYPDSHGWAEGPGVVKYTLTAYAE